LLLVAEGELHAASAKAIKLIQQSQKVWSTRETCTSCHHQLLPEIPLKLARERAVPFDEAFAASTTRATFAYLNDLDGAVQGYEYIDVFFDGLSLVGANTAGLSTTLAISASAQFIASHQRADGSWYTMDGRPPQSHSSFTTTAACARAIRDYLPDRMKEERETRIQRARQWLTTTKARTTEDHTFQLLGLHWTRAGLPVRKRVARELLSRQRPDGGWSELPALASDAYSTGQVLVALREAAELPASDPAYQRGLRFLLKTQAPDGSWLVKSRLHPPAPVSPPYFETGFPYKHDQFISVSGTSWAAAAMLHALPIPAETKRSPAAMANAATEHEKWARVALNGTAAELKGLLDSGMNPNSRTAGGTTALMLAANDLAKVKLLIERGADVNARAETGITPLMVAARYHGNIGVVRLLLEKGARPLADKGVEVRYNASAFFFAVMAGDKEIAAALLDAGARIDPMTILGRFKTSPLVYATFSGNTPLIEYLIAKGASVNETDEANMTPLAWAAINNHPDAVRVLLRLGARVNHVDVFGMTPLMYAASIDYGDTAVMEQLIAAGADVGAKNKEGLTALELARNYNHSALASLLARKPPAR
jgi:ankyrin repeat protein